MVAGIVISLLLHGLLIFGYRLQRPAQSLPGPVSASMTIWLLPPAAPRPLPEPEAEKKLPPRASPPVSATPARQPRTSAPAMRSAQTITVPTPSLAPDPFHPEQGPKKFDMDAALKTARKVASEPDPARAKLPVAQLDKKPLYPESHESQLARDIASGKRPDCRSSAAGAGLLAPLIWLTDKKDSGCKW